MDLKRAVHRKDASWKVFKEKFLPFVQERFTSHLVRDEESNIYKLIVSYGDSTAEFKLFSEGGRVLGPNRWEADETPGYLAYYLLEIIWWGYAEYELGFLKSPYYDSTMSTEDILDGFQSYMEVALDCNRLHALCGTEVFNKLVELEVQTIRNGRDDRSKESTNDT